MGFFSHLKPAFRKRSRLRAMIRGYSELKRQKRIGLGRWIKSALIDTRLPEVSENASSLIFGASTANAERSVRQFLFERHVGTAMNRAILHALGSQSRVVFALPQAWLNVLETQGLSVDRWHSSLAWWRFLLLHFGRNVLRIGQILLRIVAAQTRPLPRGRYAYFDGLSAGNLPQSVGCSYDICSWYAQWNGRIPDVAMLLHGVDAKAPPIGNLRVERTSEPFMLVRGAANIARFLVWAAAATLLAAADLLRGRWWHALMLAEAAFAKAVALSPAEVLAADYLFHFSGTIYRPLWTYEAERKGARILCYFYSTSEQAKLDTGYESQKFEWGGASWPIYLVWDAYQEDQLRRDLGNDPEIWVVGPIWFSAGPDELDLQPYSIAVFDIEAHRLSSHFPFTTAGDYIAAHPDFSERFLRDVQRALAEHGFTMAFKKKREIGKRGSNRYRKLMQEIGVADNVVMVAPNASALQLIERCAGVISMPFTSTAHYLRDRNIPSVYYDPTGWIQRGDRAAHGIPVLIGIDELRRWISDTFGGNRL